MASLFRANDKGNGTARAMSQQAWYDIDRAVPLTRLLAGLLAPSLTRPYDYLTATALGSL
jgi:hypothetical protein